MDSYTIDMEASMMNIKNLHERTVLLKTRKTNAFLKMNESHIALSRAMNNLLPYQRETHQDFMDTFQNAHQEYMTNYHDFMTLSDSLRMAEGMLYDECVEYTELRKKEKTSKGLMKNMVIDPETPLEYSDGSNSSTDSTSRCGSETISTSPSDVCSMVEGDGEYRYQMDPDDVKAFCMEIDLFDQPFHNIFEDDISSDIEVSENKYVYDMIATSACPKKNRHIEHIRKKKKIVKASKTNTITKV